MPYQTKKLVKSGYAFFTFLLVSCYCFSQRTVTGKVTDNANKQPIVGLTVQVRGSKTATQTNAQGPM